MKLHFLSGGRLRMRKSIFLPDAERTDMIELPVGCALLRHPEGNVLFDTGCHPAAAENPEARWGDLGRRMVPIMPPGDNVITALARIGLKSDDIDVVVCSHLHPDHCGCNTFFKKATFVIHAREIEAARAPGAEASGYFAAEWVNDMPIDALIGERDLFDDGRIVLCPLPGHTPGSIGAYVALDGDGAFFLASDTVTLYATLSNDFLPRNTWNADELAKSLDEVRRIEAGGAKIICGHDAEQWAGLRKGVESYA